jgi:hypothetical protein
MMSMARAMFASTYIRQLRSGLPRCCLHGRSRRKDGTHLFDGRSARADLRCGHAATHPTCPTHPAGVSELSTLSTLSRKGRSLRNQTLLEITPEGDGEFARHCNDHDALNAPVLPFGPLHQPLGDRALGFQAIWIMVARTGPLPAREIPWERSIWPLSYGCPQLLN